MIQPLPNAQFKVLLPNGHELLAYLSEALSLPGAAALHPALGAALDQVQDITLGSAEALDLKGLAKGSPDMRRVSELQAAARPPSTPTSASRDTERNRQRRSDDRRGSRNDRGDRSGRRRHESRGPGGIAKQG